MGFVLGSWYLRHFLLVREVTLRAEANGHSIDVVVSGIAGQQARLHRLILVRYLPVKLMHTRRDLEPLLVAHTVLQFRVRPVRSRRVLRCRWRRRALEIDVAAGEPRQLGPVVQAIVRRIDILRYHDLLARHLRKVVVGGPRAIQVRRHCLEYFLLTRSVVHPLATGLPRRILARHCHECSESSIELPC